MNPATIIARYLDPDNVGLASAASGFTLKMEPLAHRRYKAIMLAIAELHHRRRTHGVGGGLLVTGPSGAGKSTIAKAYLAMFPRQLEADRTRIPVLFVSVPPSPTSRSLAGAILEAMGQRKAHRGTTAEKTTTIYSLFAKCEVELILLDEFQHLFYAPTLNAFRDVTDWLKNLLEQTKVGMASYGLSAAEMVVNSNEQLARRFSAKLRIAPFSFEDPADFHELRGILKALEAKLPLPCEVPLYEANLARRIVVGSYGLLDYVVKILEGAVSAAVTANLSAIDLQAMAAGFRNRVWRDVPDQINPFHPQSPLRSLDRAGEAFFLHSRQDLIGSPVARKLGMNMTRGGNA